MPEPTKRKPLGRILLDAGVINSEQLDEALNLQRKEGGVLGQILVTLGHCRGEQIAHALAVQAGMQVVDLGKMDIPPEVIARIPANVAKIYRVVPIEFEAGILTVAMADPTNIAALDDLMFLLSIKVRGATSSGAAVDAAIEKYYGG